MKKYTKTFDAREKLLFCLFNLVFFTPVLPSRRRILKSRFWRENAMIVVIQLNYWFLARMYVVTEISYQKFYHFAIDYFFFWRFEPLFLCFTQCGGSSPCVNFGKIRNTAPLSAFLDMEMFWKPQTCWKYSLRSQQRKAVWRMERRCFGISLSLRGLLCCQNFHTHKNNSASYAGCVGRWPKNQHKKKKGILTSLIHEVPTVPDTSSKSQPMEQNKL